jgi:ATPase subunit of ABC transporter with duplicated ATPase domains
MQKNFGTPSIILKDITFEIRSGSPLLKDVSISFDNEKSGLVGKNGSGKTVLLRCMMGELEPTRGAIERKAIIGYLPQDYQFDLTQSVSDALEITHTLQALKKISEGDTSQELKSAVGQDWDIKDRAEKYLLRFGLKEVDFNTRLEKLSGGERMKIILAKLLLRDTNFLILDEPTNNLDADARQAVYELIESWPGGLLVVSHDRQLLNLMDRIVELSEKGIAIYGGNYEAYREQKDLKEAALQRQVADAEKEFKKVKNQAQATKEKQQKRVSHGKKIREKTGMPSIILGKMKETSEKTSSRLSLLHEDRIADASDHLAKAQEQILPSNVIHVDLIHTEVPRGKLVSALRAVDFRYPDSDRQLFKDLNVEVFGPSRISIDGPNGSGKSTLIRLMLGELQPTSGEIVLGIDRYAYLDQRAAVLDQKISILENLKKLSGLDEAQARNWLGKFLFPEQDVFKKVAVLSGGERMRAALACILAGEQPPLLLVLDEPTNNLDLDSIEQIESALAHFRGCLIVISHDKEFIKNIGTERSVTLNV